MSLDCLVRGEGREMGGSVHSTVLTGQLQEFICKTFFVINRIWQAWEGDRREVRVGENEAHNVTKGN